MRGVASAILFLLKPLRDVKGFLPESLADSALEDLTEEERELLDAAQARQASCLRRFLGEEGDAVDPRPRKQLRVATHRLLSGIDNALRVATGCGLERFASRGAKIGMVSAEHRDSLAQWVACPLRSLPISGDQAPCGPMWDLFPSVRALGTTCGPSDGPTALYVEFRKGRLGGR